MRKWLALFCIISIGIWSMGIPCLFAQGTDIPVSGQAEGQISDDGAGSAQAENVSSADGLPPAEQAITANDTTTGQESQTTVGQQAAPAQAQYGHAEEAVSENISLDFKDADIKTILRVLSLKSGINIVAGRDVAGPVTIRLADVPWDTALDVILKTYGYGSERTGNIITVTPIEKLTSQKEAEQKLAEVQPVEMEVFKLKFLDANDAKKVIEPQLSPRGRITVLAITGQKGWSFGSRVGPKVGGAAPVLKMPEKEGSGPGQKKQQEDVRSKTLIVADIPPHLEKIRKVIELIDKMPKQILIEAHIVEVNRDFLKDMGFDYSLGSTTNASVNSTSYTGVGVSKIATTGNVVKDAIGGDSFGSKVRPAIFNPRASLSDFVGGTPFSVGSTFIWRQLTGMQFEVMIHALSETVEANVLSAPRVLTIDNQEANIVVVKLVPVLEVAAKSTEEGIMTSQTLDYYENIGIQLFVVPQVSAENYINMIIHPVITSYTDTKNATAFAVSAGGSATLTTDYPYVELRETETQVLMKDGETIVIGGLLRDVKATSVFSTPILGDIPIIGELFKRRSTDTEKIDLLIFIKAHIINTPEEANLVRQQIDEISLTMPSNTEVLVSGNGVETKADIEKRNKKKKKRN